MPKRKKMNSATKARARVIYVVNQPSFFVSHRMALARRVRDEGYDVSVITPAGDGVEAIRSAGFDWHPMRFDAGGMNPLRDFVTFLDLLSLFRRFKPAIVHNVTIKPVLYGTFAARLAGIPCVINAVSGLGYLFTGQRVMVRLLAIILYRVLMRHPNMRVILQNREDMAQFRHYHLAPALSLCLIRGSGVDVSNFSPWQARPGPPIVMQVSRMVGDKGLREFIAAAAMVHATHPQTRFLLVGPLYPGNPSALSEDELRRAEKEGHVTWLGPRSDIAELLAQARIFCLPSYREGLPKALLEAGASGLPSVTTDTSGCREVIRPGVNGLLVPVGDASALAEAIIWLLDEPEEARIMGMRARKEVEQHFSLDRIIEAQVALYREAGP
jgi:glycosyltransferase involved in cell wall biosynthesis